MARQWQQLSLEDAKRHPLYGIKNWLALYAFGVLIAPLRAIGEFSNAAHESGLTLSQLLSVDIPTGAFIKASLAFNVAIALLLLWLLFSKHRNFRVASVAVLVLQWPAYFGVVVITGGAQIPGFAAALTLQFLSSLLLITIWVAYLQMSRRVRVTFENCVVVEKVKASVIHENQVPLGKTQATTTGNEAYAAALAEIEEHRLDKGTWARSFGDSGGDESKAKVLYIKARAESTKDAAAWIVDTRPSSAEDASINVTDERKTASVSPVPVAKSFTTNTFEITVWVIFVLAFFACWQYMEYSKRQAATPNPVQAPAPQLNLSEFKAVPNIQTGTVSDQGVITPPAAASSKVTLQPLGNSKSFSYEEATATKQQPAQVQPAKPQPTVSRVPAPAVDFSAEVQADLNRIAERALKDYPYLDTPAGQEVRDKIVKRRDELVLQGVYPSIALTRAVNDYAPANAPRPAKEAKSETVLVEGNHNGFPPKCRWVTPQEWSCK